MAKIAIYLIDDQTMMRAALRALLDRMDPFEVVGDTGDPQRAIADVIGYRGIQEALKLRRHHLTDDFAAFLDRLVASGSSRPIFAESGSRETDR